MTLMDRVTRKCSGGVAAAMTLLSLSSLSHADAFADVRCYASPDDEIALELRLYTDSEIWVGGLVRYRGSEDFITLVPQGEETVEEVPGRPWKYKTTWLEIVDGQIHGRYEVYSQGALTYDFVYVGRETGERVDLSVESAPISSELDLDGVCDW